MITTYYKTDIDVLFTGKTDVLCLDLSNCHLKMGFIFSSSAFALLKT